jgi:hypothetical protein
MGRQFSSDGCDAFLGGAPNFFSNESERSEVLIRPRSRRRSGPVFFVSNPQFPQCLSVFLFLSEKYQRAGLLKQVNNLRGFRSGSITLSSGSITPGSGQVVEKIGMVFLGKYHGKRV